MSCCVQNIHVTAYSPLGTPPSSAMFKDYQPDLVMNDPVVKDMAKKYNKNVGQVHTCTHIHCFASLHVHCISTAYNMYKHIYMFVYVCIFLHTVFVYIYTVYMYICVFVYVYKIYMFICMYIYVLYLYYIYAVFTLYLSFSKSLYGLNAAVWLARLLLVRLNPQSTWPTCLVHFLLIDSSCILSIVQQTSGMTMCSLRDL